MGQVSNFEFTEEELLTFLADIESEDQDMVEAEIDTVEELDAVVDEKPAVYNRERAYVYAQRRKERVRKINDMAFEQKFVDLKDYISKEHAQLIITTLCQTFDSLINRYSNYITERCNKLLAAKMPRSLRACYKAYPKAFIKNKGFVYTVPTIEDKPTFFYVELDVPYYFEQGTEQDVIESLGVRYYGKINEAVCKIEDYQTKKYEAEANYALKMAKLPRSSYLELLKAYPYWFELLIKTLSA